MPSSYTTSLRLTLPATGELSGQWGTTVNTGITELLDSAVAGTASISTWGGAGVAYTLSNNSGLADEARKIFIVATGSPGEAKNVICPAVSKFYVFRNDTAGGFALTLKTGGGTGISVPAGQYKFLYCNGTDVVEMFNSAGALTLSGALSVGGTTTLASNPTLSAGTANQVQYLNASKVLVGSANLTFDGTTLTANAINTTTLDLTNIEVTNVKAKDGTSAATIADSTGVVSFTANPVLSGGTANGVTYLDGSKVLTSGSALTFDGQTLTNTRDTPILTLNDTAASNVALRLLSTGGVTYVQSGISAGAFSPIAFTANGGGSEQMRLTSTGLSLASTSDLTLNKGTANGVTYLNASKVLTSGSALTFDGTKFTQTASTTGILSEFKNSNTGNQNGNIVASNDTGTAVRLQVFGSAAGSYGMLSTGSPALYTSASELNFVADNAAGVIKFGLSGSSEQMRLNSTGLGIGTSSPGTKLDVTGTDVYRVFRVSTATGGIIEAGLLGQSTIGIQSLTNVGSFQDLLLQPNGGNLGIGTSSPTAKLEAVGGTGAGFTGWFRSGDTTAANNAGGGFYNTSSATAASRSAIMALDADGANLSGGDYFIIQKNGNSGTADILQYSNAAIRFGTNYTNRAAYDMILDSSGNLGLGVTPSAWGFGGNLELPATNNISFKGAYGNILSNAYYDLSQSRFEYTTNGYAAQYQIGAAGQHQWHTAPSGTAGNAISFTQAMTLDADGELGVGITSPTARVHAYSSTAMKQLTVDGTGAIKTGVNFASSGTTYGQIYFDNNVPYDMSVLQQYSTGSLIFGTNNTERAQITSGGYFKASNSGTYFGSTGSYHELTNNDTNAQAAVIYSSSTAYTGASLDVQVNRNTTNATFYAIRYFNAAAGAARFYVADSGNVTNTNGTYGTISDAKMKTDIVDAGSQWADIKAIRFRKFKMKDDPAGLVQLGVVAQELEQTSPGLVDEHIDRDQEGNDLGTTTKSVKTSVLLMKAAVALQEAMARIEQLEARVAALEA